MARAIGLALALATAAGCGGTGTDDMVTVPADLSTGGADLTSSGGDGGMPARFSTLYADYFNRCANCHAPTAPGRTSNIEMTLDFSSVVTAHRTITAGMAAGLTGNQAACNGAPFIQSLPEQSLILAVLDQPTRTAFDLPAFPNCDATAITDQALKVGSDPSPAFLAALKQWIGAGAPNN